MGSGGGRGLGAGRLATKTGVPSPPFVTVVRIYSAASQRKIESVLFLSDIFHM
jgi:hypothetical protein